MFERSYQPRHLKENLVSTLAPGAEGDDEVFRALRNSSLRCDQLGPIDISPAEVARWKNSRSDLKAPLSSDDYGKSAQIRLLIQKLSRDRIEEQRSQYFEACNRRRLIGEDTDDLRAPQARNTIMPVRCAAISSFFQLSSDSSAGGNYEIAYIDLLVSFLNDTERQQPRCFLCISSLGACNGSNDSSFDSWEDVWKHSNKAHRNQRLWPLSCPECSRLHRKETFEHDLGEWCAQVHEHHAPPSEVPPRCLLGCQTFSKPDHLKHHLDRRHRDLFSGKRPLSCPECCRLGLEATSFDKFSDLRAHVEAEHDRNLLSPSLGQVQVHRCLLCDNVYSSTKGGLSLHNTKSHIEKGTLTHSSL